MWTDAVREGSRARRSWEREVLRGADGGGRGLRGWRGRHQTQQEGAAAAGKLVSHLQCHPAVALHFGATRVKAANDASDMFGMRRHRRRTTPAAGAIDVRSQGGGGDDE